MLVDDKLAKEKLIREVHRLNASFPRKELSGIQVAQLIRNTDLTDCQPPMENMTDTQAGNDPSIAPSGTPIVSKDIERRIDELIATDARKGYGTIRGWTSNYMLEDMAKFVALTIAAQLEAEIAACKSRPCQHQYGENPLVCIKCGGEIKPTK